MACKISRERKQQIKTVPFMMAARRTVIVTQIIYTKAGRLKGMQREEAGTERASWWGAEICVFELLQACHRDSTCTSS